MVSRPVNERPILLLGSSGMLGFDLKAATEAKFRRPPLTPAHSELDITDREAVGEYLRREDPGYVLNAAAYTNVDGAERERDLAWRVNALGPSVLAEWCAELRLRLVHFSTDQVFDGGLKRPATEADQPHPLNCYAATKLEGETAVLKAPGSLVLRVQWLYGRSKDRFRGLRQKKTFSPFSDQVGCPTWTRDVALSVLDLLERDAKGLFHFSYDDWATWAEVYQFVKAERRLDDLVLTPRPTSEANLPAARPLFSVLDNRKLRSALGRTSVGGWRERLHEFLRVSQ